MSDRQTALLDRVQGCSIQETAEEELSASNETRLDIEETLRKEREASEPPRASELEILLFRVESGNSSLESCTPFQS